MPRALLSLAISSCSVSQSECLDYLSSPHISKFISYGPSNIILLCCSSGFLHKLIWQTSYVYARSGFSKGFKFHDHHSLKLSLGKNTWKKYISTKVIGNIVSVTMFLNNFSFTKACKCILLFLLIVKNDWILDFILWEVFLCGYILRQSKKNVISTFNLVYNPILQVSWMTIYCKTFTECISWNRRRTCQFNSVQLIDISLMYSENIYWKEEIHL